MNQELHNQFLNAASVMVVMQKFDAAIQCKSNALNALDDSLKLSREKPNTAKKLYRGLTRTGKFLTIFGSILIAILLPLFSFTYAASTALNEPTGSQLLYYLFLLSTPLCMLITGIALLILAHNKRNKFRNNAIKELADNEKQIASMKYAVHNDIQRFTALKEQYWNDNYRFVQFLPPRYHNPQAVSFMLQAIENLRADNLTDAINLYEQELHHLEQMRVLNNHVEMQRLYHESISYAMETIKRNQELIKSDLRFIQTIQMIDAFR